ncbi:polysaccharide deacetylase [Saccharibacillus kuerlensis]|uniref:NodB homology domain-containing protein n=1 Tax=Saccharibacillus kuerlensis TaxID=459527 RepID=A0ABQ2L2V1_9BACL|nr:polysaccharide deacetylase [Saccharibacillus kuerlensis]GGN98192.1 hypothetical protein GCM10010969_16960 [Saccharibacillus kuerlensis]
MNKRNSLHICRSGMLIFIAVILFLASASITEAAGVRVFPIGYNDELTDIKGEMHRKVLYVPIREVSEKLHLRMSGTSEKFVLQGSKHSVTIIPGKQQAVSGSKTMSIQTYVSSGRTMIPASLLKSTFNFGIAYDASVPVARITSGKQKLDLQGFVEQNRTALRSDQGKTEGKPQQQKPTSKKPIYLTFDDGPTPHTDELLNILDQYKARGTFFMLGPNITAHPGAVKRLVQSGSAAGLHGISHEKSKFYASPESALEEMKQDNEALHKAAGIQTTLIRTPYGSKPYFTQEYRDKVLPAGFHLWDWNVDSEDWKYKEDHEKVIRSVLEQIEKVEKQGTVPIVLMHDQAATLKVLPEVLKTLRDEGFSFEVLKEGTVPVNFWHDKR